MGDPGHLLAAVFHSGCVISITAPTALLPYEFRIDTDADAD